MIVVDLIKEIEINEVCDMIKKTCLRSFSGYYPKEWVDYTLSRQTVERISEKINRMSFYVAKEDGKIVGSGAIGEYYEKNDEACIFSFFVDPDFQGKGIGRAIMQKLEKDMFFNNAKRVYVPSSIPAIPFYKKMGYDFVGGNMVFEDGSFLLEKLKK